MHVRVVFTRFCTRIAGEAGATIVEYGLLLALVAVIVASAAAVLGDGLGATFRDAGTVMSGQGGTSGNGGGGGNGGNSGSTNGWGNGSGGGQGHNN